MPIATCVAWELSEKEGALLPLLPLDAQGTYFWATGTGACENAPSVEVDTSCAETRGWGAPIVNPMRRKPMKRRGAQRSAIRLVRRNMIAKHSLKSTAFDKPAYLDTLTV